MDVAYVCLLTLLYVNLLQQYSNAEQPHNLISVINLTDLAIKRIIRMAKKITPFTTMCQADQIALLKGGCTELMILRSVINYDPDKNSWRVRTELLFHRCRVALCASMRT